MEKISEYAQGLLDAQRLANEASNKAMQEGKTDVAHALAELSTDLLLLRERVEQQGLAR